MHEREMAIVLELVSRFEHKNRCLCF
jgi:hypothetical protein